MQTEFLVRIFVVFLVVSRPNFDNTAFSCQRDIMIWMLRRCLQLLLDKIVHILQHLLCQFIFAGKCFSSGDFEGKYLMNRVVKIISSSCHWFMRSWFTAVRSSWRMVSSVGWTWRWEVMCWRVGESWWQRYSSIGMMVTGGGGGGRMGGDVGGVRHCRVATATRTKQILINKQFNH